MALDVRLACSRVLPEALTQLHPSDADHPGTAVSDADHAAGHPDAADRPDAGTHPGLPVHLDRPADGAGRWADHALACPDAYLHPAKLAAAG